MTDPEEKAEAKKNTYYQDPISNLRTRVFNLPLLQQQDLVEQFKKLDAIIQDNVDILMKYSMFVEQYLSDAVAEVAANITHGRTVYERDSDPKEEDEETEEEEKEIPVTGASPSALFKRSSDIKFIETGVNLMNLLCFADYGKKLKSETKIILSELKFARKVYEDMIDTFLYITKDYVEMSRKFITHHNELYESNETTSQDAAIALSKIDEQMALVEKLVGISRRKLYHVCLHLRDTKKQYLKIRESIITPYLRVAYKEAKSKSASTEQFLENFQNGSAGLLRAVSCYSLSRKVGFAAYAKHWVRQSILVYIKEDANFVKLPSSMWQAHTWIEKVKDKALTEHGEIDMKKLSSLTGYSESKLQNIYDSVKTSQVYSLDYIVDEEQKTPLGDVLISTKEEDSTKEHENRLDILSRLDGLSDTEKIIMYLIYGMFEQLPSKGEISEAEKFREMLRQTIAKYKLH